MARLNIYSPDSLGKWQNNEKSIDLNSPIYPYYINSGENKMNIKGFILEIKEGVKLSSVKNKLEELVGEENVVICPGHTKEIVMRNNLDKVEIYGINIDSPDKDATVALIRDPYFSKLINPATEEAVVPKVLEPYLDRVTECYVDSRISGAQG